MKKLLFATALVASAAAFADGPINAISFEGYDAGDTFVNGDPEKAENGTAQSGFGYFYYDGEQDGSSVKAFGGENAAAPAITRPLAFANASPNANYLDLSTEGGILWRGINNITQSGGYGLGDSTNIVADGIYLDTLVQFTPTEDGGTPELDGEDKLAIWLNVETREGQPPVTNLMVRAGYVDDNGTSTSAVASNFVLVTSSPVVAGTWYRLTVKTIADVTQCKTKNGEYNPNGITGFEIYLDGVQLAAATTTIGNGYIDRATDPGEYGWLDQGTDADFITYLQSGKVFPSLKGETSSDTLTAVGFKGSGALDDIVWTEEDPFAGGSSGSDYKVVIDGSDVVVTPTQADLEAIGQALPGLNVTDPTAVNAVLATEIEGSDGIPAWQALFLGLAPTTNDLEKVKITSVSFDNDGKVVLEMNDELDLKTNRGVVIQLKVYASSDLTTWGSEPIVTATDTLTIPAISRALGETYKFYKVVVDFAPPPPANQGE